jgi:atypical dual specificity phosphatase
MINFDHIEADIFLGSAPASSVDVARLATMKITAVLSLQSDEDFKTHQINWEKLQSAYNYNKILLQRFPILDFDEIDLGKRLAEPVQALHLLLSAGHRVYVHCNAGVCRAPATVLGYLCHYRGMTLAEGLDYIRQQRPQANPYIAAVKKTVDDLKLKS